MQPEIKHYHDVITMKDVMLTMRDGVQLATDLYLPAVEGKVADRRFPVLIERTAYNKDQDSRSEIDAGASRRMSRLEVASHFVKRGFVVVYQDCRGRHGSEGGFVKYLSEAQDGEDTVRWVLSQAWCDGKIGTMGLSYSAHSEMALASLSPPGLEAMVLDSGGFSSAFHGGIRQGGAFEMKQVTWAFRRAKESLASDPSRALASRAMQSEDLKEWFKTFPWAPGHSPLRWAPEYEQYLFEQWGNDTFGDYWKQPGIYAAGSYDAIAHIPQVHMSSWYDTYVRTALENFDAMRKRDLAPVRLIMGPWLHGDRNVTYSGDVEFGSAAAFDGNVAPNWRDFRCSWFERWLKGTDARIDDDPVVRLFVMGGGSGRRNAKGRIEHGGRWVRGTDWPLPGTEFVKYHLHRSQRLTQLPESATDASLTYDFDPNHPVPTIGGALTSGAPIFDGGAFDQRETARFFGSSGSGLPLSARRDVLVFQTDPLLEDIAIVGPIVVKLFVSSNCVDTDFTAKLVDVYPSSEDYPHGFAMNLSDGILRCRFRDSWQKTNLMEPGRVYEITIELFATANLFKAGHRVRLDISSSNFPKYDVNPNTGGQEALARSRIIATNTVHLDSHHDSHVVLPTVRPSFLTNL